MLCLKNNNNKGFFFFASLQLTDETRKCFRDTFYRLARSSQEKLDSDNNTDSGEFHMQASRYDDYGDNTTRYRLMR